MMTATRTVRRSLVLAAVVCRASIEENAANPEAEALHARVLNWLTLLKLWDETEPDEEVLLRTPIGQLEPRAVIHASWHIEGLAIFAWALGQLEFPQHDEQMDSYLVTDALWFLDETAGDMVANAQLRSAVELDACRELLYAVHCRLLGFVRDRQPKEFVGWIENSWLEALNLNVAELIFHNDLAIDGKAISEVEEERLQECCSIIYDRHRAIIWLVEGPALYSEVTVDT